jgi:hypothetical protein
VLDSGVEQIDGGGGLTKRGPNQDPGPVGCHNGFFVFYLD